ncbi:TetR/AcrR family transcriptional regulator [Kocuria coralli]|uniref:TetR/AcrR family transcriptional regulator n=1 Tax=Kocuria coralli TaxID=1461025 RepID=A0A5J5KYQ1_9MICC|nr:TetR/AcrR family transcriptional regulator [Kocuria coralli]KAA9394568.1 TetR/AcrR family transcriptional regulator [Kocuria coralli]
MTSNIRRRANTRARLLDAAEELITETGVLSFGIDVVCERAGFTRGAFYSNFTSVDDLLFTLYERKTEHLLEEIDSARPSPTAPAGDTESSGRARPQEPVDLESAVDRLVAVVPADPQWYSLRAVFALRVSKDDEIAGSLHVHAEELRRGLTPFIARIVEAAGLELTVDAAEATRVVIAAHVGSVLQGALVEDPERLRRDTVLAALRGLTTAARPKAAQTAVEQEAPERPARPVLYALTAIPGGVHRVEPETGETTALVTGLDEVPDGMVVDPESNELVFTLMGSLDGTPERGKEPFFTHRNGSVQAISLVGEAEGRNPRTLVERGTFTTGKQLTRDPETGRLYWADREGHGIYRSERDGSAVTPLVLTSGTTRAPDEDECVGVAVDPVNGHLYWTQKGPADGGRGRILRAGLEIPEGMTADSREDIEVLWQGLPEPIDLELDLRSGMLTWTDRGAEPDGNTLNRAPIPAAGERGGTPQILARGFQEAIGVALDQQRGVAYVSDLGGSVRRVDLVTGAVRVIAELSGGVTGIVLHQEP